MPKLKPLAVCALLLLAAVFLWHHRSALPVAADRSTAPPASMPANASPARGSGTTPSDFLPREARDTLTRIASGGPFEHRQDGVVFGNYEGLLPRQPRGYYHEYTVDTPGARTRGTRRIITGGTPPSEYFYT